MKSKTTSTKTVTSKFVECIVEGTKIHIKFSDDDMSFEVIEFQPRKRWWTRRPAVTEKTIYTGTSELFQVVTKQMLYALDGAMRQQKEVLEQEVLGINAFKYLLEKVEQVAIDRAAETTSP